MSAAAAVLLLPLLRLRSTSKCTAAATAAILAVTCAARRLPQIAVFSTCSSIAYMALSARRLATCLMRPVHCRCRQQPVMLPSSSTATIRLTLPAPLRKLTVI